MNPSLSNKRKPGEDAAAYRVRRRTMKESVDRYLRLGLPAQGYVNGPHRTHQPHRVTEEVMVLSPAGIPEPHEFTVLHPGTLIRSVK